MNICDDCLDYEIPECVEYISLEFSAIETGVDYLIELQNHFGDKQVLNVSAAYSDTLLIEVSDLPEGYFFRGNYYQLKIFESEEARQCDSPLNICGYETCITLKVSVINNITNVTLECC